MRADELGIRRLINSGLVAPRFKTAEEVVAWFGGVQAQDFGPAKWSLGQRIKGSTDADIERAFNGGKILRTHVLRPTWHFVTTRDIRWLLELTGPRIQAHNSYRLRQLDLDARTIARGHRRIERHLRGTQLTRAELRQALEADGISTEGQRFAYMLMSAELEGLICSGSRRGNHQTYALLDERVRSSKAMSRDAALAELTRRFFTSHGPATIKDFGWWSSLTTSDIKAGLEMNPRLRSEEVDGIEYWLAPERKRPQPRSPQVQLLHGYDEYVVAYTESKFLIDESGAARAAMKSREVPVGVVIVGTQIAGHWKRTIKRDSVAIEALLHRRLTKAEETTLQRAAKAHGGFLELDATLTTARV